MVEIASDYVRKAWNNINLSRIAEKIEIASRLVSTLVAIKGFSLIQAVAVMFEQRLLDPVVG